MKLAYTPKVKQFYIFLRVKKIPTITPIEKIGAHSKQITIQLLKTYS